MSVVIKTSEMQYRDGSGAYHGINAIAEKKIADQEAALDAKIASTQAAVDSLEAQKNTIAATIASMAQLGTDTTLTTPGMAADAATVGDLKSALNGFGCVEVPVTNKKYINLSSSPITMTNGVPTLVSATDDIDAGYIACQQGDKFTVSGTGGASNARLWAFVASDGTILSKAAAGITEVDKIVIAPPGAAFFITNTYTHKVSYKGISYKHIDKYVDNPVNVFDPDGFSRNAESNTFDTMDVMKTGVHLIAQSSGSNRFIYVYLVLKANTEYVFRAKKHTTVGLGFVMANESNDGGKTYAALSPALSLMSSTVGDDVLSEKEFTTTTGLMRVGFYVSGSTSAKGDVVYSDVMVVEKSNDPGFFVPYVTSNDYYAQGIIAETQDEIDNISNTVAETQDEIGNISNTIGYKHILQSDIIQGSYNRDGSVVANSYRIRLEKMIPISVGDRIRLIPGQKANNMIIGIVNNSMYTFETGWLTSETIYTANITGSLMLMFKNIPVGSSDNVQIVPSDYDASVTVEYVQKFESGAEKYNGNIFRVNYAEAIPYPVRNSSTYSVSYADIITKYDNIRNRVATLYNDVSDLVPKPLTITKTNLQMTDSGYQMYKYTFTPAYPKKTVFMIAGTHGNEYESVYCLYNIVKAIYTDTYTYPQLRSFMENVKLVIIPVVNPYGFEHNTKMNGDGVNVYEYYNDDTANQPKEIISVKDVFASETIDYFMDMHTDPYNNTSSKNCYGYALPSSVTFPILYKIIMRFREIVFDEFNMNSKYISSDKDIIVGRISSINGNSSVAYAERRDIPANLIEISTGYGWGGSGEGGNPPNYPSFAAYGSADMVRVSTDFYTNVLLAMVENLLGIA